MACFRGGRAAGYLRFVERREGGMTICEMPQITRFLGPVLSAPSGKREARSRTGYSIITEILEQLAGYDHVEMTLDTECSDLVPFLASGFDVKVHPTILLDCKRPRDELWAGLRDKTKNVIRRARECLTVRDTDDIDQFIHCYRTNLDGAEPHFDFSLLAPAFAAARARDRCKIVTAVDSDGVPHAQVFFIWDDKYVYYFLSTRDKGVAHLGAVSLLVWTGIELAHSSGRYFDFDGGITDDAGYKFKVAFGGEMANRFDVVRSTSHYRIQRTISKNSTGYRQKDIPARMADAATRASGEPDDGHRASPRLRCQRMIRMPASSGGMILLDTDRRHRDLPALG